MPAAIFDDPGAVIQINPLEGPNWDATLAAIPGSSFFHGSAWLRVLAATYDFTPTSFIERKGMNPPAVMPIMEVSSWITGRRGISLPFTDECTPLAQNSLAFNRLFESLSAHGEARKWKYCELRGGRPLLPNVQASASFWGHTLALERNKSFQFARFSSSARRAVRKAEQSTLRVQFSTSLDAARVFYRLLCKTRRRHGLPPQPRRFFDNIHSHILSHNQGIVVLAYFDEVPIAGAIFFHRGTTAIYKFGASDEAFQHFRANNLVMWRAIEWLAERQFQSLDFGRTAPDNDGLRRFKLSWGTSERTVEYFRRDLSSSRFVSSRDATRGWHNRIFRIMPPSLSRLVGAAAYRHIA